MGSAGIHDRLRLKHEVTPTVDDKNSCIRTLNYGNYGKFLIMGYAGCI